MAEQAAPLVGRIPARLQAQFRTAFVNALLPVPMIDCLGFLDLKRSGSSGVRTGNGAFGPTVVGWEWH